MRARFVLFFALVAVGACESYGTVHYHWLNADNPWVAKPEAGSPFQISLKKCVAKFDPGHLAKVGQKPTQYKETPPPTLYARYAGSYDPQHITQVRACMDADGYRSIPDMMTGFVWFGPLSVPE